MTFVLSTEQLKQMITESADLYFSNNYFKNKKIDDVCDQCWQYFNRYMEYYKIKKHINNFYVFCTYEGKNKFNLYIYFNFSSLRELHTVSIKFLRE